ncbi:laminin subunit alpha-like, partial [Ylistrum balloti]|uniref:laminin subunit alpha-like n=1 Tax=Ylistrum balloti TaxID=509963 RepID=UPI0029058536
VYVTLYPPMNVSIGYISDETAYVYWFAPPVYIHVKFNNTFGDPNEPAPGNIDSDTNGDTVTEVLDKQKEVSYTYNTESENTTDIVSVVTNNSSMETVNSSSVQGTNTTTTGSESTNSSSADYTSTQHQHNVTIWTAWTPKYVHYNDSVDKQPLEKKDVVNFLSGHLIGYIVKWWQDGSTNFTEQQVNQTVTELHLTELTPNTTYRINVSAVYDGNKILTANTSYFTTSFDTTKSCQCDTYGTVPGHYACNFTSRKWCKCRSGFGGLFCEQCAAGYYRNAAGLPCWKCPCDDDASTGSCHFKEEFLHCDECKHGYAGNLCHKCSEGYFRYGSSDYCKPCACKGNSDKCNPYTGECIDCKYNTTGFSCGKCKKDYEGDPNVHKNCTHKADLKPKSKSNTVMIALVCVLVVLILSAIAGIIIYRKWKDHPAAKPFWTVELQDDHEGVNFSSVPEDDFQARVEDMNFYEKHDQSKSKRGTKKYSPLREDL